MDAAECYDTGEARGHLDDLATEWRDTECRIDRDWWVVSAAGGEVVAVAWVWPETAGEVPADHFVHPDHRGTGLAATLLDCVEARRLRLGVDEPRVWEASLEAFAEHHLFTL